MPMNSPVRNKHPYHFQHVDPCYLEPESKINKIPTNSVKSKIKNSDYFQNNVPVIYQTADHTIKPTQVSFLAPKPQVFNRPSEKID